MFSYIYMVDRNQADFDDFVSNIVRTAFSVDNFFTEKNINDFNAKNPKSLESTLFIYFPHYFSALPLQRQISPTRADHNSQLYTHPTPDMRALKRV